MINLNKRLQMISAFIKEEDRAIDIGCDHFLLGIYLYLEKNISIIGSDINKGPLLKAKKNLEKYHLENILKLRLGNGLECVSDNLNTLIISGMGGKTIIEILQNIKKYPNISKIIVSPNNDFPLIRKYLAKKGFKIEKEQMILENNKYYLISVFVKGKEKINYLLGKLDIKNEDNYGYFKDLWKKNKILLTKIPTKYLIRRKKIQSEQRIIQKNLTGKRLFVK